MESFTPIHKNVSGIGDRDFKGPLSENEIIRIVLVKKKKKISGHGHVQRENDVKTQKEDGHL